MIRWGIREYLYQFPDGMQALEIAIVRAEDGKAPVEVARIAGPAIKGLTDMLARVCLRRGPLAGFDVQEIVTELTAETTDPKH